MRDNTKCTLLGTNSLGEALTSCHDWKIKATSSGSFLLIFFFASPKTPPFTIRDLGQAWG